MRLYKIANWREVYETGETRKLKDLKWVPVPNKHDGLGFRKLVVRKDRCELLAAWVLLLQIASKGKQEDRGILQRDCKALSPEDLSIMTGFPVSVFVKALEFFASQEIAWLVVDDNDLAAGENPPPEVAGENPEGSGKSPLEGKGREGKGIEEKGREGNRPESPPGDEMGLVFPQNLRTPPFVDAWGKWVPFRMKMKGCKDWVALFQGQLDWLGALPEVTATAMLLQSIRNGWKGLFELKWAAKNGGASISDMKSVIQAKEKKAAEIKHRCCSEVAMGDSWTDDAKRREYLGLRREIKQLNEKISSFL